MESEKRFQMVSQLGDTFVWWWVLVEYGISKEILNGISTWRFQNNISKRYFK